MNYSEEFTNGIGSYFMEVEYYIQFFEWNVVVLWACVFGCKVIKSRDVIRITVKVESNSKAKIQKT